MKTHQSSQIVGEPVAVKKNEHKLIQENIRGHSITNFECYLMLVPRTLHYVQQPVWNFQLIVGLRFIKPDIEDQRRLVKEPYGWDSTWRFSHGLRIQSPDFLSSNPKTDTFVLGLMNQKSPLSGSSSESREGTHPVLMHVSPGPTWWRLSPDHTLSSTPARASENCYCPRINILLNYYTSHLIG